jgi:DNA-binding IclR family transcriptional regulator
VDERRVDEASADAGSVDTALGKGLRALDVLAAAGGPVRLSHLADQLGMQKSSVHRILRTLVDSGFASQDPVTGLYAATLKVWELGASVVGALPIKQAATTVLQELHRATAETVSLTILDGDDVLYLDKIVAARPMGFTTRIGSRVPAPLTVSGRAMLAYEDDARTIVERVAARRGVEGLDVDQVLADVERARVEGYITGRGRAERGIIGIAAAVAGPDGTAAAGLTVSAPVQRLDDERQAQIVEALLVAAAGLGEAVGRG